MSRSHQFRLVPGNRSHDQFQFPPFRGTELDGWISSIKAYPSFLRKYRTNGVIVTLLHPTKCFNGAQGQRRGQVAVNG